MKKRIFIIIVSLLVVVLYGVGVYATYNKYRLPDVKYFGINEAAECDGISYKLKDVKTYTLEEICEEYDFTPEEINLQIKPERLYYVATFEIERVDENGSLMYLEVGKYNKYISGNYSEIPIESFINNGFINNRKLDVGEKMEYKFVKSLINYQFSEETFKKLDKNDMWLRIYSNEDSCECYFGNDL